ncbi:hypothetical protein JTL74_33430, partial [Pseudomonas aeruginosa]|nr:hypothetical protein [Pseudomonas aeruginosa]
KKEQANPTSQTARRIPLNTCVVLLRNISPPEVLRQPRISNGRSIKQTAKATAQEINQETTILSLHVGYSILSRLKEVAKTSESTMEAGVAK